MLLKIIYTYLAEISLIWLAVLFYHNPYYKEMLRAETLQFLIYLAIGYTLVGLPLGLLKSRSGISSRSYHFAKAILKLVMNLISAIKSIFPSGKQSILKLTEEERTSSLFYIVKIFFIPLMIDFVLWNFFYIKTSLPVLPEMAEVRSGIHYFNTCIYPLIFSGIFMVNSAIYSFGYLFEADILKSRVRTVDTAFLGWFVALICYPPFSSVLVMVIPSYSSKMAFFLNDEVTFAVRMFIVLILIVMLISVITLGTKCSNLTNRGIVTSGPYRFVRHPHYVTKNLIWWITLAPAIKEVPIAILYLAGWTFIYYLRSITEEKHLMKDPDYVDYCNKVKYRFIPWII